MHETCKEKVNEFEPGALDSLSWAIKWSQQAFESYGKAELATNAPCLMVDTLNDIEIAIDNLEKARKLIKKAV